MRDVLNLRAFDFRKPNKINQKVFAALAIMFFTLISPAWDIQYDPDSDPNRPYVCEGRSRCSEESLQAHLLDKTAVDGGPDEFFRIIDSFELDIHWKTRVMEETYLIEASHKRYWAFIEPLIERGIDVNEKDVYGSTALMYAAFCGHVKSVRLLLQAGADIYMNITVVENAQFKRGVKRSNCNRCCSKGTVGILLS